MFRFQINGLPPGSAAGGLPPALLMPDAMRAAAPLPDDGPDTLLGAWGGEVLPGAWLPGDARWPAAAIRFALLHRAHGVALIDLAPESVPEAVPRFLQAHRARYPGQRVPPVVYRSFSKADLWRLTVLLDNAFAAEPAPDPADEGWTGRARALLVRAPVAGRVTLAEPVRAPEVEAKPVPPPARAMAQEIRLPSAPVAPAVSAALPTADAEAAPINLPERPPGAMRVVAPAAMARPGMARQALPLAVLLLAVAGAGAWTGYLPLPEGWLSRGGTESGGMEGLASPGPSRGLDKVAAGEPVAGPSARSAPVLAEDTVLARASEVVPIPVADAAPVPAVEAEPVPRAAKAPAGVAEDAPAAAALPAVADAVAATLREEARPAEAPDAVPVPAAPPSGLRLAAAEAPPALPAGPASPGGVPAADGPAPGPLPAVNGVPAPSIRAAALSLPVLAEAMPVPFPVQADPVPPPAGALPAPPTGAVPRGPRPPVSVEGMADRTGGWALPVAQGVALPPEPVAVPPPAAPVLASAVAAPRPQAPALAPALLTALVRRGDAMLAIGDVSAARLLYERAAAAGSAAAATAMGRSFDPQVLATLGARGLRGDPEAAAAWYRRGAAMGDADARSLAGRLAAASHEGGRTP